MRTVSEIVAKIRYNKSLAPPVQAHPLSAPEYRPGSSTSSLRVGLAVESMRRHMTDEGWQLFASLESAGWSLCGHGLADPETDVARILSRQPDPSTVLLQDKREWDVGVHDFREPLARFRNVEALANRPDIFKLTVLKDAQSRNDYHAQSAIEIGCHAWVTYYHTAIVSALAPFVRPEHCVRTWHTVDVDQIGEYQTEGREGVLLSGAVSSAYPLRLRLFREASLLPECTVLRHPGYHRDGSATPQFLQTLTCYKVAICTSSEFGYSLRKIIESSACGCRVLTDLPVDDVLPFIDRNLVRVHPEDSTASIAAKLREMLDTYDPDRQQWIAEHLAKFYDYRVEGWRLSDRIEALRANYA